MQQKEIELTDDTFTNTLPVVIGDAGRRYAIISGSKGVASSEYSPIGGRFGFFYPDAGIMVFGEKVSNEFKDDGSGSLGTASFDGILTGSNQLYPLTSSNVDAKNALRFINCMRNVNGNALTLYGQKEVTEVVYVIRINGDDFNFTNNFSILSGSGRNMASADVGVMNSFNTAATGSVFIDGTLTEVSGSEPIETSTFLDDGETLFTWPGSRVTTMHGAPTTYITGIELFDQHAFQNDALS